MAAPILSRDAQLAGSLTERGAQFSHLAEFHQWLAGIADVTFMDVSVVALGDIDGWLRDPATGNLQHRTGRFFTVESVDVAMPGARVPEWSQPIINQPEIGILGILVRELNGVLHCLMQVKHEPGNGNGLQLSPTVQATRSNYTQVHRGKTVPYLDYFRTPGGHRTVTDSRQSEQGAWFYRKRNRNMIVEVGDDIELAAGYCWLTVGQIVALLREPDLVNMDTRTVLACAPWSGRGLAGALTSAPANPFQVSLVRSFDPGERSTNSLPEVLSWITEMRTSTQLRVDLRPLASAPGWRYSDGRISHESGRFFDVIGVDVRAGGREVARWGQPMLEPVGRGVVAFVVRSINGVLHVLMHARAEPGYADVIELAPAVQCMPDNYDHLPRQAQPPYLADVLSAPAAAIHFDCTLSEEGGRFFRARNRYMVVEADVTAGPGYIWLTVGQLAELLRHSFYVNIQARTLFLCLASLLPRRL